MKKFSAKIYTEEEAFFESLKGLYEDEDLRNKAITAFTEYLNCKAKNGDEEYDFMMEWLDKNKDITDFRAATDEQINTFGLDASPWYIDTDNYSEAE
jgi:hypothetical protein